jgi:hypothetical protein
MSNETATTLVTPALNFTSSDLYFRHSKRATADNLRQHFRQTSPDHPPTTEVITTTADGASPRDLDNINRRLPSADAKALYPQFFEGDSDEAKTIRLLSTTAEHVERAIEAYSVGDAGDIWSELSLASSCLAKTHLHTEFNEALGSLVTYCHQALTQPDYNAIDLDALLCMKKVLQSAINKPFLRLASAVAYIEELDQFGWDGTDRQVEAFVQHLLEYFEYRPAIQGQGGELVNPDGLL